MADENAIWGDALPLTSAEEALLRDGELIGKIRSPKRIASHKSKKEDWSDKEREIEEKVNGVLGHYCDATETIFDLAEYEKYIDRAIASGIVAIDTETNNSLDPITCKLMGLCLYANGLKQAYVPINHVNPKTGERLSSQLSESDIKPALERLVSSKAKLIFHNASFDIRVIQCQVGVELRCDWDTSIAAHMLDENESASLKMQYFLHVSPEDGKYDIEELFEGEEYAKFKPTLFALYASTDAYKTLRLYEWQKAQMMLPENSGVLSCYLNIEIPCIKVAKDMELAGIAVDSDYMARLARKYHRLLDEYQPKVDAELEKLKPLIDDWRIKGGAEPVELGKTKTKSECLSDPVNVESPAQLAILVYDVLGIPPVNKNKPRSMDKNTIPMLLEKHDIPLLGILFERKQFKTLVQNFIDKLPGMVNPKDGRMHCSFNQLGTVTGRFSCSNPNLQQIPSKNHEIRLMFEASPGCVLIGSDFSAQEPRLLSYYSQDEHMIKAFKDGKDLYATIGTKVYHNRYEDNLEFNPKTGKRQEEGAKRRSKCKQVMLAISYGMTVPSLAKRINSSVEEAQEVLDSFYDGFPAVRKWREQTIESCHRLGYVSDWAGRERRLPDIFLPKFSVSRLPDKSRKPFFNPFLGCASDGGGNVDSAYAHELISRMEKAKGYAERSAIEREAKSKGYKIESNVSKINSAERQCVNSRVQGGAASITKKAMAIIANDPEMKRLGFRLLLQVHDELIGEAPVENADAAAGRLTYLMSHCMDGKFNVPFKCDADVSKHWYQNVYDNMLKDEYNSLVAKGLGKSNALKAIISEHDESLPEYIERLLG